MRYSRNTLSQAHFSGRKGAENIPYSSSVGIRTATRNRTLMDEYRGIVLED